jgi:hypothetical protein
MTINQGDEMIKLLREILRQLEGLQRDGDGNLVVNNVGDTATGV